MSTNSRAVTLLVALVGGALVGVGLGSELRGTVPRSESAGDAGGNTLCGSCVNNPRTFDSPGHSVCQANHPECDTAAFPDYYINKFQQLSPKMTAEDICDTAQATGAKFAAGGMGSKANDASGQVGVTFEEAARVYFGNNPGAKSSDCVGAIQILSGEATAYSNNLGEYIFAVTQTPPDLSNPGNIWQDDNTATSISVDDSAAFANAESISAPNGLCHDAPQTVPKGFNSAGNSNFLGPFCHISKNYVNPGEGNACTMGLTNGCGNNMAWGGGQCSGGSPSTPFPSDESVINANSCTVL